MHWGTFNLALHAWDEPAETLLELAEEQKLRVLAPKVGQGFEPHHLEAASPLWRDVR